MKQISTEDRLLIIQIADRAVDKHKFGSKLDIIADIVCVHLTHGLRLLEMLNARHLDFFHDIFGIMLYLNRATGKFEDCFSPRFSC